MRLQIVSITGAALLVGCSSGGGSDSEAPPPPPPPPVSMPGTLELVTGTLTVNESVGTAEVQVQRSGGQDGEVTVAVGLVAESADASDVTLNASSITFGDGDSSAKSVEFTVVDDSEDEGNETFVIELSNPSGGASLGSQASTAVTIVDDDSTTPIPVAGFAINDTGVRLCATTFDTGIACDPAGATVDYPSQDAEQGRDPQSNNDADGKLGFVFRQLDASGAPLATPSQDYAATPWACVADDVTGLVWEVKSSDGGSSDADWRYTWFSSVLRQGVENGGVCAATDRCDTAKYVEDINAETLCGFDDWRLPTAFELLSLVDYEADGPVAIDQRFFPQTQRALYWAAGRSAFPNEASYVGFTWGESRTIEHNQSLAVRLVRGGQPL